MFTYVCIDFENIEKTAKEDYGANIDYEEFIKVIREIAETKKLKIVGISAFADFDKGEAGKMTKLVRQGVDPRHVVTKTPHEYLKGSTDIELSLDLMETMFTFPHITDYLLVGGDGDGRYIVKRLRKHGKNVQLAAFKNNTNSILVEMVDEFYDLLQYPQLMKKVTQGDRERLMWSLLSNDSVHRVIAQLSHMESNNNREFIGLNFFRNKLRDKYPEAEISEALTDCLDLGLIERYQVPNPVDQNNPTSACKLNRTNPVVLQILK